MTTSTARPVDPARVEEMLGRFTVDFGAALSFPLVLVGEQLGLFEAMADGESVTAGELARRTDTDERHVQEWLSAMAAGGYVAFDPASGAFHLEPEQALVLAGEQGPAYVPGAFHVAASVVRDLAQVTETIRTGEGLGWHEHDHSLFHGTERFFRPGYATHLVSDWIPALEGVRDKLERGGRVADIGCGYGASTILMAQAFPNSRFYGSDYHDGSVEHARRGAERAGVADRATFETAGAQSFSGRGFDLVCIFDALHDMGDPVRAARRVYEALAEDGTWMIVEPAAGDRVEDNLTPIGRVYYGFSTLLCTPASLSQEVGLALGTQAGPARIRDVTVAAGFSRFRIAAQTPFNNVFEVRR
jgi:SAM-dependent methyltransferase